MIKLCAFSDEASSSLKGQISALKRNGIFYTELRSIDGVNVKEFKIPYAKEVKKELLDNGIEVWSIGSPIGKIDINVDFSAYLDDVKHVLELSNVFGADKIRMFSFYNAFEERNKVIDYLSQMVEIGKIIADGILERDTKENLRARSLKLCKDFPLYPDIV